MSTAIVLEPNMINAEIPEIKIEVCDLKFMAQWGYNIQNNHDSKCTICQSPLIIPSVEELNKGKLKSNVLLGKCGHAFHADCINTWIQKGSVTCPIDRTPWALSKELDSRQDSWKKLPSTNTIVNGKDVVKNAEVNAKNIIAAGNHNILPKVVPNNIVAAMNMKKEPFLNAPLPKIVPKFAVKYAKKVVSEDDDEIMSD
jgi:hypothetical protein